MSSRKSKENLVPCTNSTCKVKLCKKGRTNAKRKNVNRQCLNCLDGSQSSRVSEDYGPPRKLHKYQVESIENSNLTDFPLNNCTEVRICDKRFTADNKTGTNEHLQSMTSMSSSSESDVDHDVVTVSKFHSKQDINVEVIKKEPVVQEPRSGNVSEALSIASVAYPFRLTIHDSIDSRKSALSKARALKTVASSKALAGKISAKAKQLNIKVSDLGDLKPVLDSIDNIEEFYKEVLNRFAAAFSLFQTVDLYLKQKSTTESTHEAATSEAQNFQDFLFDSEARIDKSNKGTDALVIYNAPQNRVETFSAINEIDLRQNFPDDPNRTMDLIVFAEADDTIKVTQSSKYSVTEKRDDESLSKKQEVSVFKIIASPSQITLEESTKTKIQKNIGTEVESSVKIENKTVLKDSDKKSVVKKYSLYSATGSESGKILANLLTDPELVNFRTVALELDNKDQVNAPLEQELEEDTKAMPFSKSKTNHSEGNFYQPTVIAEEEINEMNILDTLGSRIKEMLTGSAPIISPVVVDPKLSAIKSEIKYSAQIENDKLLQEINLMSGVISDGSTVVSHTTHKIEHKIGVPIDGTMNIIQSQVKSKVSSIDGNSKQRQIQVLEDINYQMFIDNAEKIEIIEEKLVTDEMSETVSIGKSDVERLIESRNLGKSDDDNGQYADDEDSRESTYRYGEDPVGKKKIHCMDKEDFLKKENTESSEEPAIKEEPSASAETEISIKQECDIEQEPEVNQEDVVESLIKEERLDVTGKKQAHFEPRKRVVSETGEVLVCPNDCGLEDCPFLEPSIIPKLKPKPYSTSSIDCDNGKLLPKERKFHWLNGTTSTVPPKRNKLSDKIDEILRIMPKCQCKHVKAITYATGRELMKQDGQQKGGINLDAKDYYKKASQSNINKKDADESGEETVAKLFYDTLIKGLENMKNTLKRGREIEPIRDIKLFYDYGSHIYVDNISKCNLYSPSHNSAIVHDVDLDEKHLVTLYAVPNSDMNLSLNLPNAIELLPPLSAGFESGLLDLLPSPKQQPSPSLLLLQPPPSNWAPSIYQYEPGFSQKGQ